MPNFNVTEIIKIHQDYIPKWKKDGIFFEHTDFLNLVELNHSYNFQLWHAEDRARRDDLGFEFVYKAKREIDTYNQLRNNYIEAMDDWLFAKLQPESANCPVHSETPGMIIDRLSILALKYFHMKLQTTRDDADKNHRINCTQKLHLIQEQHKQLQSCLTQIFDDIKNKTLTFKIYRQFKMYNDPTLNPELYAPSHFD